MLGEWLADDAGRRAYFMHKAPGVRLRLQGADAGCARAALQRLSDGRDEVMAEPVIGPYDAEICQMGGPAGLELAHLFFTAESVAVLGYHRCRLRGPAGLHPSEFSLLLLDRTLCRPVGETWEVWDVWAKMTLTGRISAPPSRVDPPGRHEPTVQATRALLASPDRRLQRAGDTERTIFTRFDGSLGELAECAQPR